MDYIEISDPNSYELRQFHDVLVEAFPDPIEREDMEILRANLLEGSWERGDEICRYHIIAARWNGEIVGGVSFYFFSHNQTALGIGSYLAVKEEFWERGIGTGLIDLRNQTLSRDARELNCHLKGLVIQVSDPQRMSAEEIEKDVVNSWEREQFWKRRGYRKIDFNFIQPSIREGEPPIEYLSFYIFPYCEEWKLSNHVSNSELRDIVDCFIKCTGTLGSAEADPAYLRMRSELEKQDHFRIL